MHEGRNLNYQTARVPSETIRAKLIAVLCLTALMISWVPHTHDVQQQGAASLPIAHAQVSDSSDSPHVFGGQSRVSSDDAHEEHSSRSSATVEICLACRSNARDIATRSVHPGGVLAESTGLQIPGVGAHPPALSLFAGLAPLRAPPTRLL